MRKQTLTIILILLLGATAFAQPEQSPAKAKMGPISAADTVMVTIYPGTAPKKVVLEVELVNADSVAGIPVPLRVTAKGNRLLFDSVSYVDSRVAYFQLKTENADSAKQTLLLGLIADLSGSKPPLAPGRGKAFTLYFTAEKPVKTADVAVEPVILPPANKLEYNVLQDDTVIGIRPTFILKTGKGKTKPKEKEGTGKG